MSKEVITETSEWRLFSDLKLVQRKISGYWIQQGLY